MTAGLSPDNMTKPNLRWTIENSQIATFADGSTTLTTNGTTAEATFRAVGVGSTTVTVATDDGSGVSTTLTLTVTPVTSSWGTETEVSGISHWTDANGTTSVEVTENGMIWLKEESGGTSAWYGIDNSAGVFEIGSRFWVRWLNRDSDPVEFANLWEQIDDEHKNSIDGDNAWLFEIGVTSPDGTAYTNLSQQVPVYVNGLYKLVAAGSGLCANRRRLG